MREILDRAFFPAVPAIRALRRVEEDLRLKRKSFRIMAPSTAQRTAFQKDRRADPASVEDRKLPNFKKCPRPRHSSVRFFSTFLNTQNWSEMKLDRAQSESARGLSFHL